MREFTDFINRQVGVYSDATSGFAKNKSIVERQVARIMRRTGTQIGDDGVPIVMSTTVEDPTQPEVIIHRIVLAEEYLAANSEGGANEQQHARAAIIFIFAYWDEEIRPRFAQALDKQPNEIQIDIMGDIRILRKAIIHSGGALSAAEHSKMKTLKERFVSNGEISLPNEVIHYLFARIKSEIARFTLAAIGADKGAPFDLSNIDQVAIQSSSRITNKTSL